MRITEKLIVLSLLLVFSGCKKDPATEPIEEWPSVQFIVEKAHNASLTEDLALFLYEDNKISGLLPRSEKYQMTIRLPKGTSLYVNGKIHQNKFLTIGLNTTFNIKIQNEEGEKDYILETYKNTGVPVIWVDTENPAEEISKDDYLDAIIRIDPNGTLTQEKRTIETEIKGRGNSTWGMPKKPYRLKFHKKQSVFGSVAMKSWVLLANYADKTLMRNHLAFQLGNYLSDEFVPRTHFVDVYINGEYQGLYHLTDQVQVNEGRVNIEELEGKAGEPITGGFLIEIDHRLDEVTWWRSKALKSHYTLKSPEIPTKEQLNYIKDYLDHFEAIIKDKHISKRTEEYLNLIDVNTFVDYYIVSEVAKNTDTGEFTGGGGFSSVYLNKSEDGKLKIGPLWDFDLAFGNVDYNENNNPEGWWIKSNNGFYAHLFKDPYFVQLVKEKWDSNKEGLRSHVLKELDDTYKLLQRSQKKNFEKWDILNRYVWPNPVVLGTYEAEVNHLKDWINQRFDWMDSQIATW